MIKSSAIITILNFEQTEYILKKLYENDNHGINNILVYGIDEKEIIASENPDIWNNIFVSGTYFSYNQASYNINFLNYLTEKFGSYEEVLCSLSMNIYIGLKILQYGVEKKLTTSAKIIRYSVYDQDIYSPEGTIRLYPSNHIDHTLSISVVNVNETIEMIELFSNNEACTPEVYIPILNDYYSCDWSNDSSVGKSELKYYSVYMINDYDKSPEEYVGLFLTFQSSVVNINRNDGIFGIKLVFFIYFRFSLL